MLVPKVMHNDLFSDWMKDFPQMPDFWRAPKNDVMRTDVKETDEAFILDIDLPGYAKEDVQITLEDGYLTVSASKNASNDEKDEDGKYIRRERFYGNCSRNFYVGEDVTEEDISAKFENGILNMTVKKVDVKPIEKKSYIQIEG